MDVGAFNRQNDRTWDRQPGKGKKEKGKGKGKDEKGKGKQGRQQQQEAAGDAAKKKCFYCKNPGHIKAECRTLKKHIAEGKVDARGKPLDGSGDGGGAGTPAPKGKSQPGPKKADGGAANMDALTPADPHEEWVLGMDVLEWADCEPEPPLQECCHPECHRVTWAPATVPREEGWPNEIRRCEAPHLRAGETRQCNHKACYLHGRLLGIQSPFSQAVPGRVATRALSLIHI